METVTEMQERLATERAIKLKQVAADNLLVWAYVRAIQAKEIPLYVDGPNYDVDALREQSATTRYEIAQRTKDLAHPPEKPLIYPSGFRHQFISLACDDCGTALCIRVSTGPHTILTGNGTIGSCVGCGRDYHDLPIKTVKPCLVHPGMVKVDYAVG